MRSEKSEEETDNSCTRGSKATSEGLEVNTGAKGEGEEAPLAWVVP